MRFKLGGRTIRVRGLNRRRRRPYRRYARKRRVNVSANGLKEAFFRLTVAAALFLLLYGAWRLLTHGERVKAPAETVAAFRAPYRSIGIIQAYSAKHDVPFGEMFALFCAENAFFPDKTAAYDLSVIEKQYVENYAKIKRKYDAKNISQYMDMYQKLFDEIACFPIPEGYGDEDGEPSFMYGDSWGVERNYEGDKAHRGADIIDRENIRGRLPVVSMTGGTVSEAGWHGTLGYYVRVETENGVTYLYAHLDGISPMIAAEQPVTAGQELGRMGDSGARSDGGAFPVHLHIGISLKVGFAKNTFWLNPYPLLRYIENPPLI